MLLRTIYIYLARFRCGNTDCFSILFFITFLYKPLLGKLSIRGDVDIICSYNVLKERFISFNYLTTFTDSRLVLIFY